MARDVEEMFDPRPRNEKFDTLKKLEERIKAYTKEAGFGLVLCHTNPSSGPTVLGPNGVPVPPPNYFQYNQCSRVAKCSKGVSKK